MSKRSRKGKSKSKSKEFDTADVSVYNFDDYGVYTSPTKGKYSKGSSIASGYGYGSTVITERCYKGHKPLVIGGNEVWGGSCYSPLKMDADIYIGLDHGMRITEKSLPWYNKTEICLPITDFCPPTKKEIPDFLKLVDWTCEQVKLGKLVHVGCIGGHGRTGMFFSALVKTLINEKDAIAYVREKYCTKAVESKEQIAFLMEHFSIEKAEPAKEKWVSVVGKGAGNSYKAGYSVTTPYLPAKNASGVSSNYVFSSGAAIQVNWGLWTGVLGEEIAEL